MNDTTPPDGRPLDDRPAWQLPGMRGFTLMVAGQLISILGSAMTRFALTIWAWELTGEATALALVGFFSFAPLILMSPFAGALVDRWPRKLVLILSDSAAGFATIAILILYLTDSLQLWHLFVAGAFAGAFEAFQFPALSATISTMLPRSQYARANGMTAFVESAAAIGAPVFAGVLLTLIGIGGILTIDIVTFSIAVSLLLFIHIPKPRRSAAGEQGASNIWKESVYGFGYIWQRPSLLRLQLLFFISNFFGGMGFILVAPTVLARTESNELILGTVQSAFGVGGVVGGLLLSTWGGFKRRIHGVLLGFMGLGILGQAVFGVGQILPVWMAGAFLTAFFLPLINGSNQAIWQSKVEPDVQGRVFAARRIIAQISGPISMLTAGFLADHLFEPAMQSGTLLAGAIGWLVGTGPGAGMGLLIAVAGTISASAGILGYLSPSVRNVEEILPDHTQE
jgi:MFS transporter, DHA3 family, macrolide efflux protein